MNIEIKRRIRAPRPVPYIKNPLLAHQLPTWRSSLVMFVLFLAFLGLGARALWLQSVSTEFLQKQGELRYTSSYELASTRGQIFDRNGEQLASSMPVKAIWAIPEDVSGTSKEKLDALAKLLGLSSSDLAKKLNTEKTFVYLRRQVENDIARKIVGLEIKGIYTKDEYKRYYPQGEVAAHIVGFTNVEDVGQEGIELAEQKWLVGKPGNRRVIRDRLGRILEDIDLVKRPVNGKSITLAIDGKIQYIAHSALKAAMEKYDAKAAAAVVLDVKTGEILALANHPTYNPNNRAHLTGSQLRNRVLTDTFEPGSTLKPFTVSLALEKGLVKPDTVIQTAPGHVTIGSATISDAHPHGLLTTAQVIQVSSNVGTAKISQMLEAKDMWEMFARAGFGRQPQIDFPGVVAGRVRPYKSWRPIEQATMSYGHGISVSLIQLARAYLVFARDGDVVPLSFKKVVEPPKGEQVFSPQTAKIMRQMLETVVSKEGTAPQAQVPGYRVGGKTGTAYKIEHGRYVKKYIASFVGLAPVSDPRIVVAVMVDEPSGAHFGGVVAAPVFSEITYNALRSLNVPSDASVKNIINRKDAVPEELPKIIKE